MNSASAWRRIGLLVATLTIVLGARDARAAVLAMTLDSSQSAITLSGTFGLIPLTPQGPGSTTASFSGPISVDVDSLINPATIQIVGSSAVAAITGQWLPEAGGGPAAGNPGMAQDANYGLQVSGGALGNAYAAVRNLEFDVTSGVEAVAAGAFASTQTLEVVSALFAFNLPPAFMEPPGQDDLSGELLSNASVAPSTYAVLGNTATLTIPISITDPGDVTIVYSGQLVATAVIPEPSSVALLGGAPLVAFLGLSRSARRRR